MTNPSLRCKQTYQDLQREVIILHTVPATKQFKEYHVCLVKRISGDQDVVLILETHELETYKEEDEN